MPGLCLGFPQHGLDISFPQFSFEILTRLHALCLGQLQSPTVSADAVVKHLGLQLVCQSAFRVRSNEDHPFELCFQLTAKQVR